MNADYRIRPATHADVPLLAEVERAAATLFEAVGYGELASTVCEPALLHEAVEHQRLWVAVDGRDQPIGFAVAEWIDGTPYLHELDVHPDHGRRGIGAALLKTVCEWARACGAQVVMLSTFRSVPWNAPFYARHGFGEVDLGALTPGFVSLRANEATHFPIEDRVIMRRTFQ